MSVEKEDFFSKAYQNFSFATINPVIMVLFHSFDVHILFTFAKWAWHFLYFCEVYILFCCDFGYGVV